MSKYKGLLAGILLQNRLDAVQLPTQGCVSSPWDLYRDKLRTRLLPGNETGFPGKVIARHGRTRARNG